MIIIIALSILFCQDVQIAVITTVSQILNVSMEQFDNVTTESLTRYLINLMACYFIMVVCCGTLCNVTSCCYVKLCYAMLCYSMLGFSILLYAILHIVSLFY